MKFIGKETKEQPDKQEAKTETTVDNVVDPSFLSSQIANTKQSFRYKKYGHIRMSELSVLCPREQALGFLLDIKKKDFVELPQQVVFDLGSALHFWFQNVSKIYQDCLHGWWKCSACSNLRKNNDGSTYFGRRPSKYLKRPCETCGAKTDATFFEEFSFRMDRPYPVTGKMDGVLEKDGVFRFVDFKTYFEKGSFPQPKDVVQISSYAYFYQCLPEEQKMPVPIDTSTSYLVYISKKFNYREPILTYPVKETPKMVETIVNQVDKVREAQDTGQIPLPFEDCIKRNFSSGRAKNCYLRDYCKEKYDQGQ